MRSQGSSAKAVYIMSRSLGIIGFLGLVEDERHVEVARRFRKYPRMLDATFRKRKAARGL